MKKEFQLIALIPARGGSKGIPGKNIKELNGKPLIAYTIEAAKKCSIVKRIIVSTDNSEIASIAKKYGAEVPFIRPSEFAKDATPDRPVLKHCCEWLVNNENYEPDLVAYLRPTTPFKTSELIKKCYTKICNESGATSLRTVTQVEGVFHPYWMFKTSNNQIIPFVEGIDIKKYYRRQLLPECFRLNGVVDILKPKIFMNKTDMYGEKIIFEEIDEKLAVDIDNDFDLKFAEFLLKY